MNIETMQRVYLDAQNNCGLKEGDWVKVLRRAESYEGGWGNKWNGNMDKLVGSVGKVKEFGEAGILVIFATSVYSWWRLPYFVLEKVEKPATPLHEFKPFDRVLVRNGDADRWIANLFHMIREEDCAFSYETITGDLYAQCIPYGGNEHLLGTTDKAEE